MNNQIGEETQKAIQIQERGNKDDILAVEQLKRIVEALEKWPNKIIDRRFFEKFFPYLDENGKQGTHWDGGKQKLNIEFKISDRDYSFQKAYKITLSRYIENDPVYYGEWQYLHFDNKTTAGILEVAKADIKERLERITNREAKIKELQGINEKELIADLIKVYKKHNKPEIWRNILDGYNVKYPK